MHDLHVTNNRGMNYWFARFVHEVWRQHGKLYPPSTMQQIVAGLQRSVHEYHSVAGHLTTVNFFQKDHSQVSLLRSALDAHMKELTRQNVGTHKKQAQAVTAGMEASLWEKGVFGSSCHLFELFLTHFSSTTANYLVCDLEMNIETYI